MQFTLFFGQNVDFISSQCSSLFLLGESMGFSPSTTQLKMRTKTTGMSVWCNSEHRVFLAPCFFLQSKASILGQNSFSRACDMSFRKSYTSFDPDTILDKKSFQKLSPFMTGCISFYFLHNNTICVYFMYATIEKYYVSKLAWCFFNNMSDFLL